MKKEVFLGEQKIIYYQAGKGFPFLIVHGWGGSISPLQNLKFQDILAKRGFNVFVISLPGFGESSLPILKGDDNDEITESILKFADKLNLQQFFIYGHCVGGLMAIKLARLYPQRIKGVVLCAVPSPLAVKISTKVGFPGPLLFLLAAGLSQVFLPPIYFLRRLRQWFREQFKFYKRKHGVMWLAWKRIMLKDFKETFLATEKIKVPTLLLLGDKENFIIRKGANYFKKIPGSMFKIVPGTNHSIQIDAPEKLVGEIVSFIETIDKEK